MNTGYLIGTPIGMELKGKKNVFQRNVKPATGSVVTISGPHLGRQTFIKTFMIPECMNHIRERDGILEAII